MLLAFVFTFSTLHKPQFASTFQTFLVSYKTKFLAQIATTILKISLKKHKVWFDWRRESECYRVLSEHTIILHDRTHFVIDLQIMLIFLSNHCFAKTKPMTATLLRPTSLIWPTQSYRVLLPYNKKFALSNNLWEGCRIIEICTNLCNRVPPRFQTYLLLYDQLM
jgi:hypothetical protein